MKGILFTTLALVALAACEGGDGIYSSGTGGYSNAAQY